MICAVAQCDARNSSGCSKCNHIVFNQSIRSIIKFYSRARCICLPGAIIAAP